MGKQTVEDVILNRRFGPLEDGRNRESVESEFGEPKDHVIGDPEFVTYGNVEVKYDDRQVVGFSLYFDRDGQIDFQNYLLFEERLSPAELPGWCRFHSLEFGEDRLLSSREKPRYGLSNDVAVSFRDGTVIAINVESRDMSSFQFHVDDEDKE